MPNVCFYFQVHQPYRLRDLRMTDIGQENVHYFDDTKNAEVFRKVAGKCYLKANAVMLDLLQRYPNFSVAYSLSGVFLDQCEQYGPDVLDSFKALANTGKVEFLAETYYHSLSSTASVQEFCEQVGMHVEKIEELFGQTPKVFRNTELIFNNEIAHFVRLMGFQGILAEGADHLLQGRSPNDPFVPPDFRLPRSTERMIAKYRPLPERSNDIHVLLKNYRLSDDVAFRFSDKSWVGFPLSAEAFTDWLMSSGGHSVNLFMDYETFGEHQWEDTGIFSFLQKLPEIWQQRGIEAITPSEVLKRWNIQIQKARTEGRLCLPGGTPLRERGAHQGKTVGCPLVQQEYDAHTYVSWADMERDLSAWKGNAIQNAALEAIYALEHDVKAKNDPELLNIWRKLQTSDHFYYMCTKYWSDGDVHKYFSPYDSPYEAYRRYSHALCDLRERLHKNKRNEVNEMNKKNSSRSSDSFRSSRSHQNEA